MKTNPKKKASGVRKRTYSVVSMFAGCGGLDYGFIGGFRYLQDRLPKLPFSITQAYENDQKAVETYRRNVGVDISETDLSNFSAKDMPSADVLIGGFPCQDFSSCGPLRGLESERGRLYQALVKYMITHKPPVVVGENVLHLQRIGSGEVLRTILADLEATGYTFKVWKMNAPDFGVPQNRTRLFLVGRRNDLVGFPEFPTPKYADKPRTIDWAIGDLERITDESVPNQSQYFVASKAKRGNGQGDEVSRIGRPSYCIRANAKSRVQFHYSLPRRLTVRECARLQTFPDTFVFPHSNTTNIMQIGNAVPPLLAHCVASSIREYLDEISTPSAQQSSKTRSGFSNA
jgi:DNA (cytosine-5)-methyltransferase 1